MIREGEGVEGTLLFWRKKYCSAKSDEKIVCSANCTKKGLFTKLAEKWGNIGRGKVACSFA